MSDSKILGLTRKGDGKEDQLVQYKFAVDKTLSLDLVFGQDQIIKRLRQVVEQTRYKKVYDYWASKLPKGLLFYGVPGGGKTFTARCLTAELDASLIELRYQDIAAQYVDRPIELLNKVRLIAEAESIEKHVVVFLDEVDVFIPNRSFSNVHEQDKKRVNFFLTWMSGSLKENQNISFVGTTNRIEMIDPAALRTGRFSEKFEFKSLSPQDVFLCLKSQLERRQQKAEATLVGPLVSEDIIPHLGTLTGADVEGVVDLILFRKAEEHCRNLQPKIKKILEQKPELTEHNALSIVVEAETDCEPCPITSEDILSGIQIIQERVRTKDKSPIGFK